MPKRKSKTEVDELTNRILSKIKELIPLAPANWKSILSQKMGRSEESITKYIAGERGVKSGQHKEVLSLLQNLVQEENERVQKLLS